ncbi:MAG: hypothetical protein QF858_01945 [Candidatus Pacebacteria bacterium]|nr:hypothetical protein [Candidatus Paceibacterota bacterium]
MSIELDLESSEELEIFYSAKTSQDSLENAMSIWNGERFPGGPVVGGGILLSIVRGLNLYRRELRELISQLDISKWAEVKSLIRICQAVEPEPISIRLIKKICDQDFIIDNVIQEKDKEKLFGKWHPLFEGEMFSSYCKAKRALLDKTGNLQDSKIEKIVMATAEKDQSWGQIILMVIRRSLDYAKKNATNHPQLKEELESVAILDLELRQRITKSEKLSFGKPNNLNTNKETWFGDIYHLADELRSHKESGKCETYQEAYKYGEKNYIVKGKEITAKQLYRSFHKAVADGRLDAPRS